MILLRKIPIPFLTSPLKGEEHKDLSPIRRRNTTISLHSEEDLNASILFGGRSEGWGWD